MIAPLINAVPVRVKIDPKKTIEELLREVQRQSIDMIPYEQTELLDIHRIDESVREASRFNTLLVVQPSSYDQALNIDGGPFDLQSGAATTNKAFAESNPNAVMIVCQLTSAGGLNLTATFDSNIMDVVQMERIVSQYEHITRQLCVSATSTVDMIEKISPRDLEEVWGRNSLLPETAPVCVHKLIENTMTQQPSAPAICSWDGNLTYVELDRLSSCLAYQLIACGAKAGVMVPLCFEKSMWHPVAALAVMKSGAACVSMDTTQPEPRLQSIVSQVSPIIILASPTLKTLASRLSDANVVVVDNDHLSVWSQRPPVGSLPLVRPTDLLHGEFDYDQYRNVLGELC
jgi:hypothetical protein